MYELDHDGPGQDIYYKGAWMLHTLRNLIGDKAFFAVTRLAVYGRLDPRPGNFQPRYTSSLEFEKLVRRVTGKDYGWFFDVYLRQAALPELDRGAQWQDALAVAGRRRAASPSRCPSRSRSTAGSCGWRCPAATDSLAVPRGAHVVVDPYSRILKRSRAVEDAQAWRAVHNNK